VVAEQVPALMGLGVGLVLLVCLVLYLLPAVAVVVITLELQPVVLVAVLVMEQDPEEVATHHLLPQAKETMEVQLLEQAHLYMPVVAVVAQAESAHLLPDPLPEVMEE
jgi:hypothetical protein